jgi:hypothetical protein
MRSRRRGRFQRIGRNDLCTCGSGLKYKKCHGRERPPSVSDKVTKMIRDGIAASGPAIEVAETHDRTRIIQLRHKFFDDAPVDTMEAAARVTAYLNEIQEWLRAILSRHGPLFWLSLLRRIPVWHLSRDIPQSELLFGRNSRMLGYRLIRRYGDHTKADVQVGQDGTIGILPSPDDFVDAFGRLGGLFHELTNALVWRRRVSRGATIVFRSSGVVEAVHSGAMERCTQLYERRRQQLTEVAGPVGNPTNVRVAEPLELQKQGAEGRLLLFFQEATDPIDVEISGSTIRAHFLPRHCGLEFLAGLTPVEPILIKKTALTVYQLQLCCVALTNYVVTTFGSPGFAYTYLTRGCIIALTEYLRTRLADGLRDLIGSQSEGSPEMLSLSFLDLLLATSEDDRASVELSTYPDCSYRHRGKDFDLCLLDMTAIPHTLARMAFDLKIHGGSAGKAKGIEFEKWVLEFLRKEGSQRVSFLARKVKLRGYDPDIDVLVGTENILFAVECKAQKLSPGYLDGVFDEVTRRREKVERWLEGVREKAARLAGNPEFTNAFIPKQFTHVVPVVCSAFPEFCYDLGKESFLIVDEIPRVCTAEELLKVILHPQIGGLASHPSAEQLKWKE